MLDSVQSLSLSSMPRDRRVANDPCKELVQWTSATRRRILCREDVARHLWAINARPQELLQMPELRKIALQGPPGSGVEDYGSDALEYSPPTRKL